MTDNNESSEFKDSDESKDNKNSEKLDLENQVTESLLDEDIGGSDSNEKLSDNNSEISNNIKWHKSEDIDFTSLDSDNNDICTDSTDTSFLNNIDDNNIDNEEDIEEYDQEIEEDVRLEIVKNMIKNNRPIQHIIEDTGYTEQEINKLKEIIALVKRVCSNEN